MKPKHLTWLGAALIASLCGAAQAQPPAALPAAGSEAVAVRLDRLPEGELKALYLNCAGASARRVLDIGEATLCSASAQALMQRSFGGDFDALIAWWQEHRNDGPRASRR